MAPFTTAMPTFCSRTANARRPASLRQPAWLGVAADNGRRAACGADGARRSASALPLPCSVARLPIWQNGEKWRLEILLPITKKFQVFDCAFPEGRKEAAFPAV